MEEDKLRVEKFFSSVVIPAFQEAKKELEKGNREISVYIGSGYMGKDMEEVPVLFSVQVGGKKFSYTVKVRILGDQIYPYPQCETYARGKGRTNGSEGSFRATHFDISELSKEDIVRDLLQAYKFFSMT
jgi:hypothetical protein